MKKGLLLMLAGMVAFGANAQYARPSASCVRNTQAATAARSVAKLPSVAARTTATPFYTQTFGGGLPSGWTTGTTAGGTWHWTHVASSSTFTMGAMNSTTASDGWMIFDSDSIGAACGCTPGGYMQTDVFNFSTHSTVRLNFENYYRSFYDSCVIWVSTTPSFTSYQRFPVLLNNTTPTNTSTTNPSDVHINITSAAALQPTVYIRFVYYGYAGGSYSWMVDDMSLSELDPVEVSVNSASPLYYGGTDVGTYSFGSIPLGMVDTVYPAIFASNDGATPFPASNVSAGIFQGSSSVYTNNVNIALPVDAFDSFGVFPGYALTANGTYTMPFAITETSDADITNNNDTARFAVTDSVWNQYPPNSNAISYSYVYRPASAGSVATRTPGVGFSVPAGKSDTLTSVSAVFRSNTVAGQVVGAQIFHYDAGADVWQYDGATKFRALTSSDISTSGAAADLKWANFKVDVATSGQIVLNGGPGGTFYVAVIKGSSNNAEVSVYEAPNPGAYDMIGTTGYDDTSHNDGGATQQFGANPAAGPYRVSYAPMVALNFGKVDYSLTIREVNSLTANVGRVFPNPANNTVVVPVTTADNAVISVTLTDVLGKVVRTQAINAVGGQQVKATFNTADLASGLYIYNVEVGGQHFTGRVSIAH